MKTMDATKFYVSRQHYWPDGQLVVEIAQGGLDYANPDMLVTKYSSSGEGEEYTGMAAAVEAAIKVAQAWKADQPEQEILIAIGCTHGDSVPFDGEELSEEVFAALKDKAAEFDAKLRKCDHCGEIIGDESYSLQDYPDERFCREYCAEEFLNFQHQLMLEDPDDDNEESEEDDDDEEDE